MSFVVLFPWLQDLQKPSDVCLCLGSTFSCGVTFAHDGVAEIKVVLPLIGDVIWSNYQLTGSNTVFLGK